MNPALKCWAILEPGMVVLQRSSDPHATNLRDGLLHPRFDIRAGRLPDPVVDVSRLSRDRFQPTCY
ncbi:MAG: hypothetical protein HY300_12315 [Verrucomicrobia bacterium]|nr:hypothetical protein [Verrucomicrobiota bacterium]